jgi:DNA polymerase III sliding clamp (beta) subunit (PCNA family)
MLFTNAIEKFILVVSESRYTLKAVYLDVASKRLMATDGHVLATIDASALIEQHDTESFLISVEAWKSATALFKANKRQANSVQIRFVDETVQVLRYGTVSSIHEKTNGRFPNVDAVIPKDLDDYGMTIRLDAKLLLNLAQSLDSESRIDSISLTIKDAQSAVIAHKSGSDFGLIMPVRDGSKPTWYWKAEPEATC